MFNRNYIFLSTVTNLHEISSIWKNGTYWQQHNDVLTLKQSGVPKTCIALLYRGSRILEQQHLSPLPHESSTLLEYNHLISSERRHSKLHQPLFWPFSAFPFSGAHANLVTLLLLFPWKTYNREEHITQSIYQEVCRNKEKEKEK